MGRKVRSKLLCFVVAAVMAIAMLPQMSLVAKADTLYYDLWICGTRVSSVNGAAWSMPGTNGGTATFSGDTLTLTNFNWAGEAYCYYDTDSNNDEHAAIYSKLSNLTINLVGDSSITVSGVTDSGNARWISGIAFEGSLTITGTGKLTIQNTVVSQEYSYGLYGFQCPININGGTIDITTGDTTESRGIYCGDLNMTSGSLTATAGNGTTESHGIECGTAVFSGGRVIAKGGTGLFANNHSNGIYTLNGMTISESANITAIGGTAFYSSTGVEGMVNITGGSLTCTASDTKYHDGWKGSYGVTDVLTIGTNASFTASGIDKAVYSSTSETPIKNSITGTGWTDTAGTEGAAVIPVSTTGQSFDYKKVQFPEVHLSNIKATATGYTGTYDGQEHGITVNISNPTSGATVKYGTTEGTYDLNTAPTYTNAGTYTVYYKITAAGYNSETGSAKVTINKASSYITTAPVAISGLTATGQAQVLITSGISSGGTMQYALGTSETSAPDSGWSTTLPGATDAGDYYVWYKVVGDDNYEGTDPACVKVTISSSSAKQEEKAKKTENIDKNQKKTFVSTVTAGKKAITLKWKKQTKGGIKGYEIQYSTDKKFKKNVKTKTIKKTKITSTTIKKLKSKKKYYIRIRTYKISGSEKVYSNWSKAKSVKVK